MVPVSVFVLFWISTYIVADKPGTYRVCSDFRQDYSKVFVILTFKLRWRPEIPL